MAMMPENFRLLKLILERAGIDEKKFRVWDPEKLAVIIDHRVPAYSVEIAENHKVCREFAKTLELKHFYDIFPGICHQVMVEKGHVLPGMLVVGADSHTTTYGALNAAATGESKIWKSP
jgi:3-isopropylmalate/(R)-2-methylmalate dehydratase large subunit